MKVTRCDFVHGLKCEQVSRHITELEGKIDSLREQLHTSLDDNHWLNEQNDKLHELVRDVWHLFTEHGAVHPCDLPVVDAVRERMRELGMEVDG